MGEGVACVGGKGEWGEEGREGQRMGTILLAVVLKSHAVHRGLVRSNLLSTKWSVSIRTTLGI